MAISIFFILEVDDWAYQLFIGYNMILRDSDFDIELQAQRQDHDKQLKRNKLHLWISLAVIIFSVFGVIVFSHYFIPDN